MKNRVNRLNALLKILNISNDWISKDLICDKLNISDITLSRYIKTLRSEGINIEVKNRQCRLVKAAKNIEKKVAFSKGDYVSLKILMYIYNNGKCSRKQLRNYFCHTENNITRMTERNLDIHLQKLTNAGLIEKQIVKPYVYYFISGKILPIQGLDIQKCIELLNYLIINRPFFPSNNFIDDFINKLRHSVTCSLFRDFSGMCNIRLADYIVSVSTNENTDELPKGKVELLSKYCNSSGLLRVTLKCGEKMNIIPLQIIYNWENEKWYLIFCRQKIHKGFQLLRLDNIKEIECLKENCQQDTAELEKLRSKACDELDKSFGMAIDKGVKIQVVFLNHFNVVEKAKMRLERQKGTIKYLDDGSLYFSGTIKGIMDFFAWGRRFGSSFIILSPQWLREKHIQSAQKGLENYRSG